MGTYQSLKQVTASVISLLKETLFKFPLLVITFLGIVFVATYYIFSNSNTITLSVSILVGVLSVFIYLKNNSVAESMLTLILGLLTAFTINWTPVTAIIFSAIFISYTFIIFMVSCIIIAAETENILMNAALHVSQQDCKQICKCLQQIADINAPDSRLGPIDRANALRFLVFMRVPYKEMPQALYTIGSMKIVYQISLEETLALYRTLYRIISSTIQNAKETDWNQIMTYLTSCPCPPKEFLDIIIKTKCLVISGKIAFPAYLDKIQNLIIAGYDGDDIVTRLQDNV